MTICAWPQRSNKSTTFNDDTVRGNLEYFWEDNNAALTNVEVNVIRFDACFTWTLSCNLLKDKSIHTAITDLNHNIENFWYQLIGRSGCTVIVIYIINSCLLIISHVSVILWRIIEYASVFFCMKAVLVQYFIQVIQYLAHEDKGSVGALCVKLYFVRLSLYATNINQCEFCDK